MIITFTGHRPEKIISLDDEFKRLREVMILNGVDFGRDTFKVGGCPGFDTIALEILMAEYVPFDHIKLLVPFVGFEKYTGRSHQEENMRVFAYNKKVVAEGIELIECGGNSGTFGQKCYKRNQALCDGSDVIYTNWNQSRGGTANTCNIAKVMGLKVINIHD